MVLLVQDKRKDLSLVKRERERACEVGEEYARRHEGARNSAAERRQTMPQVPRTYSALLKL